MTDGPTGKGPEPPQSQGSHGHAEVTEPQGLTTPGQDYFRKQNTRVGSWELGHRAACSSCLQTILSARDELGFSGSLLLSVMGQACEGKRLSFKNLEASFLTNQDKASQKN